jgi:diguanylate cyclase (GGDEF)-like protein
VKLSKSTGVDSLSDNKSKHFSLQIYQLRKWALISASFYFIYSCTLDFFRYSAEVYQITLLIRAALVLLPLVVVIYWFFKDEKSKSLATHSILSFLVLVAGLSHSLTYYISVKAGFYAPKIGLLIIIMYASLILALPIILAAGCSITVIAISSFAYLKAGEPIENVLINASYYVVFAMGCLSTNKVCETILRHNYQLMESIERQPTLDPLTGIYNSRFFYHQATQLLEQANRENKSFSLLLIKIVDFNLVNESLGQAASDRLLMFISDILTERCKRPFDLPSRLFEEKFALIFYDTNRNHIENICLALIDAVQELKSETANVVFPSTLSVSIGAVLSEDLKFSGAPTLKQMSDIAEGLLLEAMESEKDYKLFKTTD